MVAFGARARRDEAFAPCAASAANFNFDDGYARHRTANEAVGTAAAAGSRERGASAALQRLSGRCRKNEDGLARGTSTRPGV